MYDGKYIIKEVRGHEVAILFHGVINHCDIGTKGESRGETISAGFFRVQADCDGIDNCSGPDIDVYVWGESVTLKLGSREEDAKLIKQAMRIE